MTNYLTDVAEDERERVAARLFPRLDVADCWVWTGALDDNGYGRIGIGPGPGNRMRKVHRIAWELLVGPTPDGLEPDHLCRVPACASPDHIEWVTHAENIRRSAAVAGRWQARKTMCPRRHHPYDVIQTRANGRVQRACSTCIADAEQRRRSA